MASHPKERKRNRRQNERYMHQSENKGLNADKVHSDATLLIILVIGQHSNFHWLTLKLQMLIPGKLVFINVVSYVYGFNCKDVLFRPDLILGLSPDLM